MGLLPALAVVLHPLILVAYPVVAYPVVEVEVEFQLPSSGTVP